MPHPHLVSQKRQALASSFRIDWLVVNAIVYLKEVGVVQRGPRAASMLVDATDSVTVADFALTRILGFD